MLFDDRSREASPWRGCASSAENSRGWPIERLRSTSSRLTVEATSGASNASGQLRAIASAPGSYPRWVSSSASPPVEQMPIRRGNPVAAMLAGDEEGIGRHDRVTSADSGSWRNTCRVPSLHSWLNAVK